MDVVFVVMPFGSVHRPALGVSLLKSSLRKNGISSSIQYFNIDFAHTIGLELYDKVAETEFANPSLIGEFIFSGLLFGRSPIDKNYITLFLKSVLRKQKDEYIEDITYKIQSIERSIYSFIESCGKKVLDENPKVLGFTSTFHQHCASLLLAKFVKKKSNIPIILGGANCEGLMGYATLKSFPWVDFICSGEGDISFIEFMKRFLNGQNDFHIPGIVSRSSSELERMLTSPVLDMDILPYPNYDDFFYWITNNPIKSRLDLQLLIETSRGCWWGEKSHCTFCGLNGSTMKYRSKSAIQVLEELRFLTSAYDINSFQVVDNILDIKYIEALFPEIKRRQLNVKLFYETKSNLSKNQLIKMKEGGVEEIQPGIESLSDSILKLMKKGVTALQNIQLLKWCRELDIVPHWNVLFGFPMERKLEYARMTRLVPLLYHLYPPDGPSKISLDRFSPYFSDPRSNGLINVRPAMAYNFVYSFDLELLNDLAYHFDFDYYDGEDNLDYIKELESMILIWKNLWKVRPVPALYMSKVENMILIKDNRPCAQQSLHILSDENAMIYDICDSIHNLQTIHAKLQQIYPAVKENEIEVSLDDLIYKKLMISNNGKYLSLAIRVKSN